MRALWALGDRRWWRRIWSGPQADHLAWRIGTAYGDTTHQLEGEDLVAFLRWRRTMRRARR